jgi:hypothetical protein
MEKYKLPKVGSTQTWVVETLRILPMGEIELWSKWEGKKIPSY